MGDYQTKTVNGVKLYRTRGPNVWDRWGKWKVLPDGHGPYIELAQTLLEAIKVIERRVDEEAIQVTI